MAYCLIEHLRYRLKVMGHPMSVQQIREHLSRLQLSVLEHLENPDQYVLPSSISAEAKHIYRTVGLKWNPYRFRLKPLRDR